MSVAIAYLLLLIAGAVVALNSNPIGRGVQRWIVAPLFRGVGKLIGGFVKGTLKYIRRETLALAAWLGYEGRRMLVFISGVALVIFTFRAFGRQTGLTMAVVLFLFALTGRKRRLAKTSKTLVAINQRLDVFGREVKHEVRAAVRNNLPTREETREAVGEYRRQRGIYNNGGLDPATGYAAAVPIGTPPNAWGLFRDVMRRRPVEQWSTEAPAEKPPTKKGANVEVCPECNGGLGYHGSSCDTCNQALRPESRRKAFGTTDPPSTWGDRKPWEDR